jgi:hypothetical protein
MLIEDAVEETLIHRGSAAILKEDIPHIKSTKSAAKLDADSREERTSDKI